MKLKLILTHPAPPYHVPYVPHVLSLLSRYILVDVYIYAMQLGNDR